MIKKSKVVFFLILLGVSVIACKKDPRSTLGINLQPSDESLLPQYNDTLQALALQCYTVKDDSLMIKNSSYYQLGSINDPIFGITTCNIITQVIPYSDSPQPDSVASIDSVYLYMDYSYYSKNSITYAQTNPASVEGDKLDPFTVDVYELDEILEMTDSSLYSNRSPNYKHTVIATSTITPKPFDTISYSSDHSAAMVAIKLPNEIGERIANMNSSDYQYVNTFTAVLSGFYLKVRPQTSGNKGSILTLNFGGENTRMVVFYKKTSSDATHLAQLNMKSGLFAITNYNEIIHDYTTADANLKAQLNGDTSQGKQSLYIQAAAGAIGKIKLPNIKQLKNEKIIINQMKLIFTVDDAWSSHKFDQTQNLTIYYKDSTGASKQLLDQYTGIGGVLEGNEYSFYITRHVQEMLYHDSENPELIVAPSYRAYNSDAVKLYGYDQSLGKQKKIRMELIYTKIP